MTRGNSKHWLSVGLLIVLLISPLLVESGTGLVILSCLGCAFLLPLLWYDARFFGLSWASVTLLAFIYPVFAVLGSLLLGDFMFVPDAQHLLITSLRLPRTVACMLYFYVVLSWLLFVGEKTASKFDFPSLLSLHLSRNLGGAFSIAAMLLTYIVMPGIPKLLTGEIYGTFEGNSRGIDSSNFLGAGTVLLPLAACAVSFLSEKSWLRTMGSFCVPLWFFLNYARGATFGLLLLFAICSLKNGKHEKAGRSLQEPHRRSIWLPVGVVSVFVAGSIVGVTRGGNSITFASLPEVIARSLLENATALNVTYSGMVCIDIASGGVSDLSVKWSPGDLLPFTLGGTAESAIGEMQLEGLTQGGVYAPFEAFLAGGLPLFLATPFLLYFFIVFLLAVYEWVFGPVARGLFYIVLMIQVLVMPWYGFRYLSTPLLLLVPCLAIIVNFCRSDKGRFAGKPHKNAQDAKVKTNQSVQAAN